MVRRRSDAVAIDPNLIQAIPSFTFQPEVDSTQEWDIRHCLRKEYAEELFGEKVDETRAETHEFIDDFRSARELRDALNGGECELLYSGVVLDLMLLFPEILCVLLVHDAKWFADQHRRFRPNWEYQSRHDMLHSNKPMLVEFELDDAEEQCLRLGSRSIQKIRGLWSRFGMCSFLLGVETVRKRLRMTS